MYSVKPQTSVSRSYRVRNSLTSIPWTMSDTPCHHTHRDTHFLTTASVLLILCHEQTGAWDFIPHLYPHAPSFTIKNLSRFFIWNKLEQRKWSEWLLFWFFKVWYTTGTTILDEWKRSFWNPCWKKMPRYRQYQCTEQSSEFKYLQESNRWWVRWW